MFEKEKLKKIEKYVDFAEDKDLAAFDQREETNSHLETLKDLAAQQVEVLQHMEMPETKIPDSIKVEIPGVELMTIKGEKGERGEKGDKGDKGEKGEAGKDGRDGKDGMDGLDGKDGRDGKDGLNGKDGKDGKDGSPDQPDEVVEKVNKAKKKIKKTAVEGVEDLERSIQIIASTPRGGGSNVKVFDEGTRVGDTVSEINFIGSGVNVSLANGVTGPRANVTVTATGGGGGGAWGEITGTLSDQTDLQTALNAKQDTFSLGYGLDLQNGSLYIIPENVDHDALLNYDSAKHFLKSDINLNDLGDINTDAAADNDVLQYDSGTGTWVSAALPGANHNLLSATHSDTVAASPVLGDMMVGNSTPAWDKLAGNTTTTKKFLTQTGNGSVSALPTWGTIAATDIASGTLDSARLSGAYTGITGLGTLTGLTSGTILPSGTANLGSSGAHWSDIYCDTIHAGVQVIGSTVSGGDLTLNYSNSSDDAQDSSLIFERGSATPNATLTWNHTTDRLTMNFPLDLGTNALYTSGTITDGTNATTPAQIKSAYDHSQNTTAAHGLTMADVVSVPSAAAGMLARRNAANTAWEGLAIGTSGYVLTSNGTTFSWQPSTSGGGGTATAGPFLPKPDQRKFVALLANDTTPASIGAAITVTAASKAAANDADDVWTSISTSSTSANSAAVRTTSTNICRLAHNPSFKGKIMTGADITLQRIWVGFLSSNTLNTGSPDTINGQGVAFLYSPAVSANWLYVTRNGSTQTTVDSGIEVTANTAYTLAMNYDSATATASFTVNGIGAQDVTTTLPAITTNFALASWLTTYTTAVRTYKFSYLYATFTGSEVGISAGDGAPTDASYVVTQTNGDLTNEKLHPADGSGNVIHRFSDLTDSLALTQIPDGLITEAKLDINNAPTDAYFLKWNGTAGKPEWGTGSPSDAQYLTLATNASLTGERVLTIGDGLVGSDGGAGGNYTLEARLDGSTLTKSGTGLKVTDNTFEPVITAGTTGQYYRGDKSWQTLDKTAVGLGSVENTALSTWAGSGNITTVGTVTSGNTTATVSAASDTAAGKVELATAAETTTGTDTGRAVTPDGLAGSNYGKRIVMIKLVDDATALTTGDGKVYFPIPSELNGWNLVDADAMVSTVSSSGTPTYQIYNVTQTADMLTTRITIDASEYTSYSAATAPVIDTANDDVATGDILRIDKDVAGTGEKGDTIILSFQLP